MITLKPYQNRVLDSLKEFFKQCSQDRAPEAAYKTVQIKNGIQAPVPYFPVDAKGLSPEMPYVCLRVPTGGGKTLLACHATGLAMTELLQADKAVVLWLVPSNTILDQTADALRDPRHPYRRALELSCGPVEVVTIEEALRLSRAAVEGQTVVIVSTIQAFRVEDPTGRKVYEQNGAFSEHLQNVPADRLNDLIKGPDGKPKPSLVNMLRLRRPIVIVDEAHNARTELSFSTLGNVLPSCIVEFTATPALKTQPYSNVLHRVSAAELKAANMIRIPLRVITREAGQRDELLAQAITLRGDLEKLAAVEGQKTGEYLRPILLIQAPRVDDCEPLRDRMTADFAIPKDEIKISTARIDDLKGVADINSPNCPVRHIITVEKLREGWDCPFAYVLCSLKETHAATAIEQIVGRILRLPKAEAKKQPDLNCSYAFSVSRSITEVLAELRQALESNGFTAAEAERIILPVPQGALPLGSHPQSVRLAPAEIDKEEARSQVEALGGKIKIDPERGEVTFFVPLDQNEVAKVAGCFKTPEAKAKVAEAAELVRAADLAFGGTGQPRDPSPYQQALDFIVPLLCVRENGELFEFEETCLLEHPWKLSEKDASLGDYNPSAKPTGKTGIIDVGDRGDVTASATGDSPDFVGTLHQQLLALGNRDDWTVESLVAWLDRNIRHQDIPAAESAEFLRKAIHGVMTRYGLADLSRLALDRFRFRDAIEERIRQHRDSERKTAFQAYLLPKSALAVDNEQAINFKTMMYEPSWEYDGGFQFKKHYFGPKPGELSDRTPNGHQTEESKCAQFIDGLPEVKFWVRNLPRKSTSFRLQTSKDWFYPDFICRLNDGRVLAVEYKGEHLWADAEDKRAVGMVWESRSNGRCLFVMPTAGKLDEITRKIGGKVAA